jgi:hypothetical protein
MINKEQAQKQLSNLEKEVEKLKAIINAPEDIKDKVKTYSDACLVMGEKELSIEDFSNVPVEFRKSTFAIYKLQVIAKALNQGWTPNWSDTNQAKWYPYFDLRAGGFVFDDCGYDCWDAYYTGGSRLCFQSEALAKYAGTQFTEIYREFMIIE